jgi:hypothetical protein
MISPEPVSPSSLCVTSRIISDHECQPGALLLTSGFEISSEIHRLMRPSTCLFALERLTEIAGKQQFVVGTKTFDLLFHLFRYSASLSSRCRLLSPEAHLLESDPLRAGTVGLLHRIFSFADFYFVRSLTTEHLKIIRSEFPDADAFALAEALIPRQWQFAAFFAEELAEIAPKGSCGFIRVLGSLARYPELDDLIRPYFEEFVVWNCRSPDFEVMCASLSALAVIAENSQKMASGIGGNPVVRQLFAQAPADVESLRVILEFALRLIRAGGLNEDFVETLISFLRLVSQIENDEALELVFEISIEFVRRGLDDVVVNGFEDLAFWAMAMDLPYGVKRSAMVLLCMHFCCRSGSDQERLIRMGIVPIISLALEVADEPVREMAIQAVESLHALAMGTGNADTWEMVEDLCSAHECVGCIGCGFEE